MVETGKEVEETEVAVRAPAARAAVATEAVVTVVAAVAEGWEAMVATEARAGATLGWAVGTWAPAMEAVLQVVVASAAAAGAATAAATAVKEGAGAPTALEEGPTAGPRRTDGRIEGGSWQTTRPCSRCGSTRSCRHCTWPAHLVTRSERVAVGRRKWRSGSSGGAAFTLRSKFLASASMQPPYWQVLGIETVTYER